MKQLLIILAFFFVSHTAFADGVKVPEKLDNDGFRNILADAGKAYIAGQPTRAGLERMKANGVETIINLRTPSEMQKYVDFDEKAAAEELGLTYIEIPLGGDEHPFTPEALATFAEAMKAAKGKPLVHCASAYRASHMWTAYLTKYEGLPLKEAMQHGRAANLGTPPMELLLGGVEHVLQEH